ncbi:hypothetical protein TTHERM_00295270 (macronuclear) [Tetrahymena thermophila SB210]|uniref:Uncharacterized protein n=1 Tax=Tetrahymena thermophila (strain SB210) TaxID=312017 RepID=I7LUE8_TETTS|nr:hypothetical protein TTHERM_00295270 [Tetrahymena thermophila SB210]EAR92914.4 hypothetical protein TTHERM_00295270 [Tetrahymena thermophila SB210]|eukprot:XP_001013159.4 hypothetical protein TTHERM_00295270 [Tetrahymena thermophila SB210]
MNFKAKKYELILNKQFIIYNIYKNQFQKQYQQVSNKINKMEGNFQATLPIKKSTMENQKKGKTGDQKETFKGENIVKILDSTYQNRGIFLQECFQGFDDKVEDLMRAILKVQSDMQKLLEQSFKTESQVSQKSSQFKNMVELVCIDLKFIALQAKIFENQMNEYQTRLNSCIQNNFAKENIQTEQHEISYLNDIQKAIFDNYFDPCPQQIQGSNPGSVNNCQNNEEKFDDEIHLNLKKLSQINTDQIFQETITPSSNIIVQQNEFQTIKQARIKNDYSNLFETPTDQGDAEDVRDKNFKEEEEEKDGQQKNINSIESEKLKRQFKKRYTVEQKIEIVKEITSKTFYQEKKIIPKNFLAKYQICYQTLQNWIKKYYEKQNE